MGVNLKMSSMSRLEDATHPWYTGTFRINTGNYEFYDWLHATANHPTPFFVGLFNGFNLGILKQQRLMWSEEVSRS